MSQSIHVAGQEIAAASNGQSAVHELFALTDEQILEIEPEAQDVEVKSVAARPEAQREEKRDSLVASLPPNDNEGKSSLQPQAAARIESQTIGQGAEPPRWVAEAMNDPQRGGEARAFWEGSQKAQQEAAAFREVFAKPEEARAAAERARVLDDIDRAYFGATGNSAEQTNAVRTQLAQMMLRENPAAFREMVFAGLRALEQAGNGTEATGRNETASHAGQQASQDSSTAGRTNTDDARNAQLTAYAAFERAANEDLEKSVGGAIERTIDQALPSIPKVDRASVVGAQHAAPLQARLQSAIRQEVEKALQGDRQLGEQIGQILSARRFDGETRAQVVRLIDERAKQLVPGAAKRVLQDWTQTTLAAHRSRTRQNETAAARSDLAPANSDATSSRLQAGDNSRPSARNENKGGKGAKVDYRKLSDEQILEL
jgi:hypothetical protein